MPDGSVYEYSPGSTSGAPPAGVSSRTVLPLASISPSTSTCTGCTAIPSGLTLVTLYGKPGCCLCDEAKEAIKSVRLDQEFELREVDVSLDPALHRRYGERIPVVEIDGREAFELHLDAGSFRDRLGTVTE